MASETGFDDHTRFSLLGITTLDHLSEILRLILSANVLPADLVNEIKKCGHSFRFNAEQWRLIQNAVNAKYSDFDITLCYTLIRNMCTKVCKPTNGWGIHSIPNDQETTLGDDIERIRIIRNEIFGHTNSASISETEFRKYWSIIFDVCKRMEAVTGIDFPQRLQSLQNCIMDKRLCEKYQRALQEARFVSREIAEIKEILTDRQENAKETSGASIEIPGNPRKSSGIEVRTLSSGFLESSIDLSVHGDTLDHLPDTPLHLRQLLDNDNTFHETEQYRTSYEYLLKFSSVAIVGPKGSGKSAIALAILKKLDKTVVNGKICKCRFNFTINDIQDDLQDSYITILYLSDVLEELNFQVNHCQKAVAVFNRLYENCVSKKTMFVLLTVNDGTWEKYLEHLRTSPVKCSLFPASTSVRMGISENQSVALLRNHLLNHGFNITRSEKCSTSVPQTSNTHCDWTVSDEYMNLLAAELVRVAKKEGIGFHTICHMIALDKKLFERRSSILNDGFINTYQKLLQDMRYSADSRYKDIFCILVFIVLNGGIVFLNYFVEKVTVYENICRFFNATPRSVKEIETRLECDMKNYVYSLRGDCFALQNNIIMDTMLSVCANDEYFQEFFVVNSCLSLLLSRIRRNTDSEPSPFLVKVHPWVYPRLVNRLVSEVKNEKCLLTTITDHVIMKSKDFKSLWKEEFEWSQFVTKRKDENHEDYFTSGEFDNEGLSFKIGWYL
ncbi:uncharacterized protein LOC125675940 isoform X2 [Ostrea edulis]|nr:uncharacterized protein LOC125675940 isoform X2 [Ostrea edulis]